jgi:hypothetical protein
MRTLVDLRVLLNELNTRPASDLEDQDLDFKEWNRRSLADAVSLGSASK